jgi:hypothetical protein
MSMIAAYFIRLALVIMGQNGLFSLFTLNRRRNSGVSSGPIGCEFEDGARQPQLSTVRLAL